MKRATAAKRVEQTFLKPGRYHLGGGRFHDLSASEIRGYVDGTKRLLAAGYAPPVLFEHAPKGSDEGGPKDARQLKADRVKNGAGWLTDVKIGADGAATHVLEITDAKAAQQISDGSIKFTSPELRTQAWTDGKGNTHRNFIAHVALTHKPRNPDQSEFREPAEAMQFSLEDWEPLQMADDEDEKPEGDQSESSETPAEPDKPANPDMPDGSNEGEAQRMQRLEAIVAHLEELGVSLPDDTKAADEDVFLDRLLTGLMTAANAKKKAEPEPEEEDTAEEKPPQVVEQQGMMQYSLDEIDGLTDSPANKLLKRVAKAEQRELAAKVDGMLAKHKITPAGKKALLDGGALQFSAEGEQVPALTINQVVDLLDNTLPENSALTDAEIIAQFSLEDHPDGEKHYKGDGPISKEDAERIVDRQAPVLGGMFRR